MDESLKKSTCAIDKDGVLLIGNTGSGKSTFVNYLLRCEMIEEILSGNDVYITKGKCSTVIGHYTIS
jgi:polynucleotide 5'-kinase involved in rRNA processing